MKNLFLTFLLFFILVSSGYSQTEEGSFQLEVGLSPFSEGLMRGSNTGVALFSVDGTTLWSIGGEGGYFVQDDFAIKAGIGYTDLDGDSFFSYKVGVKYYAGGVVPFQVDLTGATREDVESPFGNFDTPDPLYLGLQGGYAVFLNDNVSFEPSLRYNISLNNDFSDQGIFEVRFGFVIFL